MELQVHICKVHLTAKHLSRNQESIFIPKEVCMQDKHILIYPTVTGVAYKLPGDVFHTQVCLLME